MTKSVASQEATYPLQQRFIRQVIALDREYLLQLEALKSTLSGLQQQATFSVTQRDELFAWRDELQRRINTYQTLCAKYQDALISGQHLELMAYMLFGDVRSARTQKNIDEYIQMRGTANAELKALLVNLDSQAALGQHLQLRLQGEKHIRRFLDESPHYRARRSAG
ncbi:hypothetical protein [Entomohabitans teleogrylli]|uniref:hypothetical protein n=1 Tax=Entomohabitans teleogrylli TaxID=1384589 RepID=UPI00073D30DC|nr:hypothetical protein [Entomohabitans teleogrylli]